MSKMGEINDDIKELSDSVDELELILEAKKKGGDISQLLTWKKIEDGMIDAFDIMSEEQERLLLRNFTFRWYDELNDENTLKERIKKARRSNKLNDIL